MATITKGYTFGSTEQVTNIKLHSLVDSSTLTNVANADIAAGAAIDETKISFDGSTVVTKGANQTITGNKTYTGALNYSGASVSGLSVSGTVNTSGTPAANDISVFTDADTIKGLSYSELLSHLSITAGASVDTSGTPVANDIARFTDANTIEGLSYAELLSNLSLTAGVKIDTSGTPAANDIGIFTDADTMQGWNYAELRSMLSLANVDNTKLSTWAGTDNVIGVGTLISGVGDAIISAASTTLAGKVELATAAEINTGTDTGRAISPDSLAGSNLGTRIVSIKVVDDSTAVTTGDGKVHWFVPVELNGMNLVGVEAGVSTASSSGAPTIQLYNVTDTADMLSTKLAIDANEKHSNTCLTLVSINTANDDVATGDEIRIDVDAAGTGAKGLQVDLKLRTP